MSREALLTELEWYLRQLATDRLSPRMVLFAGIALLGGTATGMLFHQVVPELQRSIMNGLVFGAGLFWVAWWMGPWMIRESLEPDFSRQIQEKLSSPANGLQTYIDSPDASTLARREIKRLLHLPLVAYIYENRLAYSKAWLRVAFSFAVGGVLLAVSWMLLFRGYPALTGVFYYGLLFITMCIGLDLAARETAAKAILTHLEGTHADGI